MNAYSRKTQRTGELLLKSLIGLENEHSIQLELLIDEKIFQRLNENWLSPQQLLQPYDTERWHLSCELHLSQGVATLDFESRCQCWGP